MKVIQDYFFLYRIFVIIELTADWKLCNGALASDMKNKLVSLQLEDGEIKEHFTTSRMQDSRPNIVLLMADDMGWGDLGVNWPKTIDTPNLDSIAKEGLRFTDFHAGASVCAPSRAALLTGRLGLRTGVVSNFGNAALGGIPTNETTLAEILYNSGYQTAMLGKWHLGMRAGHHPLDKGFQSYLGIPYSVDMGCADPPGVNRPECLPCPHENSVYMESTHSSCFEDLALPLYSNRNIIHQPVKLENLSTIYAEFAHNFIQKSFTDKTPYFLYAAFSHVHVPLAHAPIFSNLTGRGIFADTLHEMDWLVGKIKESVKQGHGYDNTLIWFISDNGPWAVKCELAGSVGPFTGDWQQSIQGGGGGSAAKQTVWEAGHRVPALVQWPLYVQAGRVSDALVSSLDILPTVVALSNSSLPLYRDLDGQNIEPLIKGMNHQGHQFLFHPNSGAAGPPGEIGAIRLGSNKVVYYSGGSPDCFGHAGPVLYHLDKPLVFHLDTDPMEGAPVDSSTPEYHDIMWEAVQALSLLHTSIRTDNISTADYISRKSARPCCDARSPICRCPWD